MYNRAYLPSIVHLYLHGQLICQLHDHIVMNSWVACDLHILSPSPLDCSAGQTAGCGMVPAPSCDDPNPTQTAGVGCFCPMGMVAKADGTCVTLENCIGQSLLNYVTAN